MTTGQFIREQRQDTHTCKRYSPGPPVTRPIWPTPQQMAALAAATKLMGVCNPQTAADLAELLAAWDAAPADAEEAVVRAENAWFRRMGRNEIPVQDRIKDTLRALGMP